MANTLKKELHAAYREISGLTSRTETLIGEIAVHNFHSMQQCDAHAKTGHWIPVNGYILNKRYKIDTYTPYDLGLLDEDGFGVQSIEIGELRRTPKILGHRRNFPAKADSVEIQYGKAWTADAGSWARIGKNGTAGVSGMTLQTRPRNRKDLIVPDNTISWDNGYESAESLHEDYSTGYQGALAVASLVHAELQSVHRAPYGPAEQIQELQQEWRGISPDVVIEASDVLVDLKAGFLRRE